MLKFLSVLVGFSLIILTQIPPATAVEPDEILSDPVLEQRARELSAEVRCLVCQNQSIDDSNAPLAKDLRVLIREKLVEGLSNQEILDHLVARYGDFVLLKPRFGGQTLLLWFLPALILIFGIIISFRLFRRRPESSQPELAKLSQKEKSALTKILDESD